MLLRQRCSLYHDVILFCDMFQHANPTKMYEVMKSSLNDLLAWLSILLVSGLTAMLTIEKPRKQSMSRKKSINSFWDAEISRKVQLFSNKPIKKEKNSYVVATEPAITDLVMLYTWLSANEKATKKYIEFYLNLGYDVLKVHTTIQDAIQPETGSQVSADHVVMFLKHNKQYSSIMVHGMSIGGYSFGESLVKIKGNLKEYEDIPGRFIGQVFDSGVDYRFTSEGLSKTLAKNPFIQKCIHSCFSWFLKINYKHATRHYENSSQTVRLDFLNVPTLFIGSKVDPLSTPEFLGQFAVAMKNTRIKCFDESPHIQHYRYYPEEYEHTIKSFLKSVIAKEDMPSGLV